MTDQPRSATVTAVDGRRAAAHRSRARSSRVLANHGDVLHGGAALRARSPRRSLDAHEPAVPAVQRRPAHRARRASSSSSRSTAAPSCSPRTSGPMASTSCSPGTFLVRRAARARRALGPGDLIGETALLSGGAFKSDVVARGKSLALCLPAADFRELIMTHPHVLEYIGEHAEHEPPAADPLGAVFVAAAILLGRPSCRRRRRGRSVLCPSPASSVLGPEQFAERVPAERRRDQRGAEQQVDDADEQVGAPAHRVEPRRAASSAALGRSSSATGLEREPDPVGAEDARPATATPSVSQTGTRMR